MTVEVENCTVENKVEISLKGPEWRRLEDLMARTGAEKIADVFSNALRLYEACVKEIDNGSKVIIRREDGAELDAFGTEEGSPCSN